MKVEIDPKRYMEWKFKHPIRAKLFEWAYNSEGGKEMLEKRLSKLLHEDIHLDKHVKADKAVEEC